MSQKNKKDDGLDTETTFADMNVEGFAWYNPSSKNKKDKKEKRKVSRKEYWQMVRGMFSAILLPLGIFIASMGVVAILLYLWFTS